MKAASLNGNGRMAAKQTKSKVGRLYRARPYDKIGLAWPQDLTVASVKSWLAAAAIGQPRRQVEFIDQMLESDPVFPGIYQTRRIAVTGLPWEIVPDPNSPKGDAVAAGIAEYCTDQLRKLASFERFLCHNFDATLYGPAVTEIVWTYGDGGRHVISELSPVSQYSLVADAREPWKIRILTESESTSGLAVDDHPDRFIVHVPSMVGNSPFRGSIGRRCSVMHLTRRFGFQWWLSATEMFGTPYRRAKYKSGVTEDEKTEVLDMLDNFGHAAYIMHSENMEFDLLEQFRGADTWPHPKLIERIDEWYAILILGQTLTTKVGETGGAYAAAKVHDQVRRDIRESDLKLEAATIRSQLLAPMVTMAFGRNMPVPDFRRITEEPKDMTAVTQVIDSAVNRLGLTVTKGWAHAELGIPLPDGENADDPLPGAPQQTSNFGLPFKASAVNRLPDTRKQSSPVKALGTWINEATGRVREQVGIVTDIVRPTLVRIASRDDLDSEFAEIVPSLPRSALSEALRNYFTACQLAGMYHVRRQREPKRAASGDFDAWNQGFARAVEALRDRLLLTPEQFTRLDRAARSRAGRVAGEFNLRLVNDIYKSIASTLESGGTLRDFRIALDETPQRSGWESDNPWHANIVMQQNAAMAYSAGTVLEATDAGAEYWEFVNYDHSCPICEPMIGKVFAMSDRKFYPPIHFNCDCWADFKYSDFSGRITSSAAVRNEAYEASQEAPGAFRYDPMEFAKAGPFNLSAVPRGLRGTFREFAEMQGWEVTE